MNRDQEKAMFSKQGNSGKSDEVREKILALQNDVKLQDPKRHEDDYHYAEGHDYSKKSTVEIKKEKEKNKELSRNEFIRLWNNKLDDKQKRALLKGTASEETINEIIDDKMDLTDIAMNVTDGQEIIADVQNLLRYQKTGYF